ncbi:MAG TPA: penicillin-insensitive murein endopeptidase [bacterium]|nr:penicillin-insensitive murein endopeptidase [bacterium]
MNRLNIAALFALLLLLAACAPGRLAPDAAGSVGRPDDGELRDGVPLASSPDILVLEPAKAYGTKELVDLLEMAAEEMRLAYPETAPLVVGHLSQKGGGTLSPHRSHQSGRDVDVAMYTKDNQLVRGFRGMSAQRLDIEKTWYFMETLLETGRVQYILLDWNLQQIMYEELRVVYPQQQLSQWFQYPRGRGERRGIIRHAAGHADHLHIRIHCPETDRYCQD